MEITKMLTISTAHVTPRTLKLLEREANADCGSISGLAVYDKRNYGFFIYISKEFLVEREVNERCFKDLVDIITFAVAQGCDMLCLDGDGEILLEIPSYQELY